ncbi:hypothetical protein M0R45_035076 [Rubus argutus]|uniref:Uncharacterized protein n=1 Tax=Rubus argutus TaxID=59490 RepID=A0AAW1VW86_RUBAR
MIVCSQLPIATPNYSCPLWYTYSATSSIRYGPLLFAVLWYTYSATSSIRYGRCYLQYSKSPIEDPPRSLHISVPYKVSVKPPTPRAASKPSTGAAPSPSSSPKDDKANSSNSNTNDMLSLPCQTQPTEDDKPEV